MKKYRVLVLGGSGFIGQHLLRELACQQNLELSWVTRIDKSSIGAGWLPEPTIIEDIETIDVSYVSKFDVVIDLISRGRGRMSRQHDISLRVRGHFRLIDGLINLKSNLHYILLSSAGAVYGDTSVDTLDERTALWPNTEYGLEKAMIEMHLCSALGAGLRVSILRVANAYGVGQPAKPGFGVIPALVDCIQKSQVFHVYGTGYNKRDYINVRDVISAVRATIFTSGIGIINIATGSGHTVNDIISFVEDISNKKMKVEFIEMPSVEPEYRQLDISGAYSKILWKPTIDLKVGLLEMFDYFNK